MKSNTPESNDKRVTSFKLGHLEKLKQIVRPYGFKNRTEFYQACTDALIAMHAEKKRLDYPPRFITRDTI